MASLLSPISIYFMRLRGVDITKAKFYGASRVLRAPGSVIKIGKNCVFRNTGDSNRIGVNHKCIISTLTSNAELTIGENCGFSGTTIGCFSKIIIGSDVRFGANTLINDGDWHLDDPRVGPPKPVVIGDNVWIGYGAIVMKGVTIGKNSIIGVNSVVTSDIPENCIAVGSPCKVIRQLL